MEDAELVGPEGSTFSAALDVVNFIAVSMQFFLNIP